MESFCRTTAVRYMRRLLFRRSSTIKRITRQRSLCHCRTITVIKQRTRPRRQWRCHMSLLWMCCRSRPHPHRVVRQRPKRKWIWWNRKWSKASNCSGRRQNRQSASHSPLRNQQKRNASQKVKMMKISSSIANKMKNSYLTRYMTWTASSKNSRFKKVKIPPPLFLGLEKLTPRPLRSFLWNSRRNCSIRTLPRRQRMVS